jgi:hypothetical protein
MKALCLVAFTGAEVLASSALRTFGVGFAGVAGFTGADDSAECANGARNAVIANAGTRNPERLVFIKKICNQSFVCCQPLRRFSSILFPGRETGFSTNPLPQLASVPSEFF